MLSGPVQVVQNGQREATSRIHLYYGSDRQSLQVGPLRRLLVYVCAMGEALQAGPGRRVLVYICITGATVPASWAWEATSRIHLITFVLRGRQSVLASWPREATSRIH